MALLIEYHGKRPRVAEDVFLAPTAVLVGDVTVEAGASIWFGAVLRGDFGPIVVGAGANVQDNAVIHVGVDWPTTIGANVTVGLSDVGPPPVTSSSHVSNARRTHEDPPYSRWTVAPSTSR